MYYLELCGSALFNVYMQKYNIENRLNVMKAKEKSFKLNLMLVWILNVQISFQHFTNILLKILDSFLPTPKE